MSDNPFLAGPDPLAALTKNLDQHITAEAFKPRAPAPWESNAFQAPVTIPEDEHVEWTDDLTNLTRGESAAQDYTDEPEGELHF